MNDYEKRSENKLKKTIELREMEECMIGETSEDHERGHVHNKNREVAQDADAMQSSIGPLGRLGELVGREPLEPKPHLAQSKLMHPGSENS